MRPHCRRKCEHCDLCVVWAVGPCVARAPVPVRRGGAADIGVGVCYAYGYAVNSKYPKN